MSLMLPLLLAACATSDGGATDVLSSALPQTVALTPSSRDEGLPADARGFRPSAYGRIDAPDGRFQALSAGARSAELDALIARYAAHYDVPETLVRRVVKRESNFVPGARNGPYWGLMQIRHDTARTMGFRGAASELLDAETNLKYAVKYLRGAWLVSGGDEARAVGHYARGYYYDAKRMGLLQTTGLR